MKLFLAKNIKTITLFFAIALGFLSPFRGARGVLFAQSQKGSDIDGEAAGDESGKSLSMPDANTVAIGANGNDATGAAAGHARIYTWNGSAWVQKGADIDGEAASDWSGWSISMPDANTVAIGAPNNNGTGTDAGHVRVYDWDGSAWLQKGADIDGEAAFDESGISVSMPDANTVAIGANFNDGSGSNAGHVRIYTWNGSAWLLKGADINGEAAGDNLGISVSMPDANTVAIGAHLNDGAGTSAGHVRIYAWDGSAWVQKGADIDGEAASDESGTYVSMPDANTIAIGANLNDGAGTSAGHVRIYAWDGSAWVQKGADIDGEAANDQSGISVSMSDANTVAIGANLNDPPVGINAGHVRFYSWNGSAWVQQCADIDGEAAADYSGYAVSMPSAGIVAIGAHLNDGTGANAGHVRIYTCSVILPIELLSFTAQWLDVEQTDALLQWQTATEINNDYFTLERSADGTAFIALGNVQGAGNSSSILNYQFIDNTLPEPTKADVFYYRLRQTDFDGQYSYSNIEVLSRGSITVIGPAPNPINDDLNFTLVSAIDGEVSITTTDMLGKLVGISVISVYKGIQQIKIPLKHLASAPYMLYISTSDGAERINKRFVIK